MTKELIEKDIQINELQLKNDQLEQDLYIALNKIDKAVEYINKITIELLEEVEKHKLTPFKETLIGKDLLKILGDKE